MRWMRRFLYSDDEPVKLAGALAEPEAEMWRELLQNNGVPSSIKIIDPIALSEGGVTALDCSLYVRKDDLERAREVLGSMFTSREPEEDG